MGISQETREQLKGFVKKLSELFARVARRIREWFQENWKWLKEAAIKWYQLEEEKEVVIRLRYKRDFSRQKISHQVMDRKPQHLIRKIIR